MYLQFFRIVCITHIGMAIANTPSTNADILYAVIILRNRKQNVSVLLNPDLNFPFLIFNAHWHQPCIPFTLYFFFFFFCLFAISWAALAAQHMEVPS